MDHIIFIKYIFGPIWIIFLGTEMSAHRTLIGNQWSNLCVQDQENEHDEEADRPQVRQRHHGHRLWVCNERQART